jgi:hypothetical protein
MEARSNAETSPEVSDLDVVAAASDPIRIVPLHLPDETVRLTEAPAAAAKPHLTYRGGHLLTEVKVFTTFWGRAWEEAPQSEVLTSINDFFGDILGSELIDELSEYSVPGQSIGHGQVIGSATVPGARFRSSVSDNAVRHRLQHLIATDPRFPAPSPDTLYFVYLPPGVVLVQGGDRSCQAFCGYHEHIGNQIYYAAMPWPGCGGCLGGLQAVEALTSTSSHELCEAITDAVPGQGWYDDTNGEIGDICAWTTRQVGKWTVQLEWSNKQGKCI